MEVVAHGLSLHGGAHLAMDTTLESPLACDGSVKRGADRTDGAALEEARRRKEHTHPDTAGVGGRARLVVLAVEVGGRWSEETPVLGCSCLREGAECTFLLQSKAKAGWLHR